MLAIHFQTRTTLAVRAEIACSPVSSGVLVKLYGVSTETHPQSGANAVQMLVRTARRAPTSSCGAPAMRSAPSCALSAAAPAFPSTR